MYIGNAQTQTANNFTRIFLEIFIKKQKISTYSKRVNNFEKTPRAKTSLIIILRKPVKLQANQKVNKKIHMKTKKPL